MKKIILLSLLFFISQLLPAQQYPLFSNYQINAYGFNPAIAGSTSYWNAAATYRTQWVGIDGAPTTQVVSLHGPVKSLGMGGYFFNDTAGKLKRTGGTATLSYGLRFGGAGELRAGAGLNVFRFGATSDASTSGTPDPLLMNNMGTTLTDLSAGIYLHLDNGFYIGISDPQMLRRQVNFSDEEGMDKELVPHYYLMTGYRFQLSEKMALEPALLVKTTDAVSLQYDLSLRAVFNQKFWIGGTYRHKAAAAGMVGYDITPAINLAYAYDLTLNDLKEASSGSHEITVGLKFGHPKDRDEDGVVDKKDECPDEPGLKELNGCPPPIVEADQDKDKDGVLNAFDKCPYTPGPAENQGCPLNGDRDQDGIIDGLDRCPDEYGLAIHEGCPFEDADGDLVANDLDACPLTPGDPANNGCPKASDSELAILELAIQNLYFDTNESLIKKESFETMDKLAKLLVEQPTYRMKIEGHTDSRGGAAFNYQLSKDRAFSVKNYLINSGVSENQLIVEYYGETKPIVSNMTEDKRKLNRRVEMTFVWE